MKESLKNYLFTKKILVNENGENREECLQTLLALANIFAIRVTNGPEYATKDMLRVAEANLPIIVPEPFYRGFPESVRGLTPEQKLFDQMVHYVVTYGFGNFDEAGHSLFDEHFERMAFAENVEIRDFVIMREHEAKEALDKYVNDMLAGTRPLSAYQYGVVRDYLEEYHEPVRVCACKDTAISLLLDTGNTSFARYLKLPDVIKLVDTINYTRYHNNNINALNLRNQDRKIIAAVLDYFLQDAAHAPEQDTAYCYAQRKSWCGLLHHIHYRPKTMTGECFVCGLRDGKIRNMSVFAAFEKTLHDEGAYAAAAELKAANGSGAVLRNLNYLLSRCADTCEVEKVLDTLDIANPVIIIQLLMQYKHYRTEERVFRFIRHGKMVVHRESETGMGARKTILPAETRAIVIEKLEAMLRKSLSTEKVGKVYIDEAMRKIAVPLQESTGSDGYGVFPRGTRLPIPEGKKIRCFVYWEKVNDIDLSCFGMGEDGECVEFSWRTMGRLASSESETVAFSGDETSGYKGGSEYFDINLDQFASLYPGARYVVFAANIYTGNVVYDECYCTAGYMMRDTADSGEVYEPKTVKSSYKITGDKNWAVLYAIDVQAREMVWLNIGFAHAVNVAGQEDLQHVFDYVDVTDVINVYKLYECKADELVDNPEDADVIVSDKQYELRENQTQVRSCDIAQLGRP